MSRNADANDSFFAEFLIISLYRSLEFSLSAFLSSILFFKSQPLRNQEVSRDLPGILLHVVWPRYSSKAVGWSHYRVHFVSCLSGIAVLHCLLPNVLKALFYIYIFYTDLCLLCV